MSWGESWSNYKASVKKSSATQFGLTIYKIKFQFNALLYALFAFGLASLLTYEKPMAVFGTGIVVMIIPIPFFIAAYGIWPQKFLKPWLYKALVCACALILAWLPLALFNLLFSWK